MPPIPIYTKSPINASKPSGVTPQTAASDEKEPNIAVQGAPPTATTTQPTRTLDYGRAQPGAVPSIPAPTGAASASRYAPQYLGPAPTQFLGGQPSPPAPQPGAAPAPPGATGPSRTSALPPPPRAGESFAPPQPTAAPAPTPAPPYPPQMSVPAPSLPHQQRGTAAATGAASPTPFQLLPLPGTSYGQVYTPIGAMTGGARSDAPVGGFAHPPGYQQDLNASRASASASAPGDGWHRGGAPAGGDDGGEEGVWDAAKKMVQAAGERLSAAETEVWKRINKG